MHDIGTYICGKTTPPLNCGGGCGETMVIFSFLFHDLGKCDLQCKIEFCVILFRRIELENLRVFPNILPKPQNCTEFIRFLSSQNIYIFQEPTRVIMMINSFCSCTTTKILRLKIKRFFPRIISNR